MKKRDLLIAVIVIIFGISYQFFEKGEISFINGCSVEHNRIIDRKYPNIFKLKDKEYSDIKEIEIKNYAGNIELLEGTESNVMVLIKATIFSKKKRKANSILEEISSVVKKKGSVLDVRILSIGRFPVNRARITIRLTIPAGTVVRISNRYGDINSDAVLKKAVISQKYGDIYLKKSISNLELNAAYSKIKIPDLQGKGDLRTRYSNMEVSGSGTLDIDARYTEYYINDFKGSNNISLISTTSVITLNNSSCNELNIKNSNGKIYIEKFKSGSIKVISKNCKIKLNNVASEDTIIKNSYANVLIDGLNGDSINLLLKNLNLNFYPGNSLNSINISASYSDLDLFLEKDKTPFFDIDAIYGKIVNSTDISFLTSREKQRIKLSGGGDLPKIVIFSKYSDIKLKNK